MLFDPIFQGLAIAMMFGAIAATGLTLIVVPLLYFVIFRHGGIPEAADSRQPSPEASGEKS